MSAATAAPPAAEHRPAGDGRWDVVVVGGGPAGMSAAVAAAERGARTALVVDGPLGGTCTNSGCVPTRVLARAARLVRDARSAEAFGGRHGGSGQGLRSTTVDWAVLRERVHEAVAQVHAATDYAGRLERAGVTVLREGRGALAAPGVVELAGTGRRVSARAVVLAAGGHSRVLPVPGIELTTVPEHLLDDLRALPASVAVVGSGNTGAQLASIFTAFGVRTELLDLAPRVLPGADPDVSAALHAAFERAGVSVRTGLGGLVRVELVDPGDPEDDRRLVYRAGGGGDEDGAEHELVVAAVVVAAGWPASTDGLGVEAAGVPLERGAVAVDAEQRAGAPGVWAAGDVSGPPGLVQSGAEEGWVAGCNAAREALAGDGDGDGDGDGAGERWPVERTDLLVLPSGGFTDPDYGQVGLTEEAARGVHPGALSVTVPYDRLERAVVDRRTDGFLKLVATADGARVLGAHAVGEHAVEVVHAVATAMTDVDAAAGVRTASAAHLAAVRFAYPTYSAVIGQAARALLAAGRR